jgi:hypothetical protein
MIFSDLGTNDRFIDLFALLCDRDAAIKRVAIDGGLGTGGSADGRAMGDAGVGEEAKGGEAKADRSVRLWICSRNQSKVLSKTHLEKRSSWLILMERFRLWWQESLLA